MQRTSHISQKIFIHFLQKSISAYGHLSGEVQTIFSELPDCFLPGKEFDRFG